MKIALLQFYSKTPTPVYDQLARALRACGHDVWVGTPDHRGNFSWHDGHHVVRTTKRPDDIRMPNPLLLPVVLVWRKVVKILFMIRIAAFLREWAPDVVQVNKTTYCGLLPLLGSRRNHFVLDVRQLGLWWPQSVIGRYRNCQGILSTRIAAKWLFDRTCFGGPGAAERVFGKGWRRWAVVTPVGVDQSFLDFRNGKKVERGSVGPLRLIYVGTLIRLRRLEVLIEAARLARHSGADFRLTLMGPGQDCAHYAELIVQMGVNDCVELRPPEPYERIPNVLSEYDVAVAYIPDVEDWLYQPALKVLEYRALGMPMLVSDLPPNRIEVEDGKNGLMVKNSRDAFAAGIARLASDPSLVAKMTLAAQQMRTGRTWDEVAAIHLASVYSFQLRRHESDLGKG